MCLPKTYVGPIAACYLGNMCWYPTARVLALIPEPRSDYNRQKEVEPAVWAAVLQKLDRFIIITVNHLKDLC